MGTVQGTFYAIGTPDRITPQPTPEPTPTNYPLPTPTPTSTPTTNPTAQPTQMSKNNPAPQPTVTITPQPSQTPTSQTIILATTDQGKKIELSITGNITSTQISNVTITTDQAISTVAFNITGPSGNVGFFNLTIPKNAISTDGAPTIYINDVPIKNQGFSTDDLNFYVWGTTSFSTHQIKIVFAAAAPIATPHQNALFQSLGLVEIAILALMSILVAIVVITVVLNKRKTKKANAG